MIAAEDVSYGAVLNGGEVSVGPRVGMVVHRLEGGDYAMQTVGSPQLWARLCAAMKRPELDADPRFATPILRRQNWPALRDVIVGWLDGFGTRERALEALRAARLPCSPVLSPAEVVAHPHLEARHAFPEVPHPARGKVRVTATPFHVDGQPVSPTAGRALSHRRAHAPGAARRARLRDGEDRRAGQRRRHRAGVRGLPCSSW